ncbi:MAG: protein translocase subunit SecD [Synechococcales cyanobacterium T60_A2020_003]|nr:protein translocase subunit SecD [Synechococcales cyanobacterium T60_A2020_003]
MGRQRSLLVVIISFVVAASLLIVMPLRDGESPVPLGLDLQGGTQLTLQVSPTPEVPEITPEKLDSVQEVVSRRINGLGVSDAVVQTVPNNNQLLVQLPGVSDPEQAERVLGETAQLDFRAQKEGTSLQVLQVLMLENDQLRNDLSSLTDPEEIAKKQEEIRSSDESIAALFDKTGLTGERLRNAYAAPINQTAWEVGLEFDAQGGDQFAALSKSVAGTGRTIGIFLDNQLISAPSVDVKFAETGITGGRASITGGFNAESANELAIQLRGGALPVPVEIVENRTVGATLGRDSIQRSLYAGAGGLVLVLLFMVAYYRLPGIIADLSLLVYALLTFATFSLLGVTLTLPGIAGFILSIGMAVDANVLIFERTREELRSGKTLYRSVESGFYRAFSSILDSNVTTLIACAALFFFGTGLVKGFALTLAIGVGISMFTAITCSRTLLLFALSFPNLRKPELFCPNLKTSALSTEPKTTL